MTQPRASFIDLTDAAPRPQDFWPALIVPRARIDAEIERLCDLSRPLVGTRATGIVHPQAREPGLGLAPSIDVTLNVLLPGESSPLVRRNSTQVDMCIRGTGRIDVAGETFGVEQFDVWNTPSFHAHRARNDGKEPWVRLTFSNAPLLEKLEVHYVESLSPDANLGAAAPSAAERSELRRARDAAERIRLDERGAELLGYEYLIDIDAVASSALHWPWRLVSTHLRKVRDIASGYTGRRLFVLYNPATGRLIGTTNSFFATIAAVPAGNIDAPHRHTSAAINYYFEGHGGSTVMGEKFEWEAGDLMLSAPGWAVHNHRARKDGFLALTIQDHPLHISMDSLLWQETLKSPIKLLGSEPGFQTNRADFAEA